MTAESIRIEKDALLTRIVASTASATRALETMIRDLRRSQWFLLVAVVGGAVIALVAIKLIALLAAAFDISFLRDVGNNVTSGGAAGGAGAGLGGGATGGGGDHDQSGLMDVSALKALFYESPGGAPLGGEAAPRGARLVYRDIQEFNGMIWYYCTPLGASPGWVPGDQLAPPGPGPKIHLSDLSLVGGRQTATMTIGANG